LVCVGHRALKLGNQFRLALAASERGVRTRNIVSIYELSFLGEAEMVSSEPILDIQGHPFGYGNRTAASPGLISVTAAMRFDQSATDTENVTMHHTYFNQTGNLLGFGRVLKASCAIPNINPPFGGEGQWSFMGIYGGKVDPTVHCDGTTDSFNGININDNVNFYAPIALGPGTPNTVYFGSDRLYRSTDRGTHMTVVSQAPILPVSTGAPQGFTVSAIGISPLNDNIRAVGLQTGNVFATVTGSSTLVDITGPLPAHYITRVVLSPTDPNVAYVAFNGYGLPPGQQVWKTTDLVSALNAGKTPTWKVAGSGIPDVSVNGLVIDPKFPNHLYAGTDFGVYASTSGGASWHRFGVGFPRVEVYDITLQSKFRILRAATHGLGFWQAFLFEDL